MKLRRPTSLFVCGLLAAGFLAGVGATAAHAYCPTDPDLPYGYSDPRAGDYGGTEVVCPPARDSSGSLPTTGAAPSGWVDVDWTSKPATGALDGWAWDTTPGPFGVGLPDHKSVYEPVTGVDSSPPLFDFPVPGQTPEEIARTANRALDPSIPPLRLGDGGVVVNKNAGKPLPDGVQPKVTLRFVNQRTGEWNTIVLTGTRSLEAIATITPYVAVTSEGRTVTGLNITQRDFTIPRNDDTLAQAAVALSNGTLANCVWGGGLVTCPFTEAITVSTDAPLPPAGTKLTTDAPSNQWVPFCTGGIIDAGYGSTARFTLEHANCDAAPGKEPVRLEIDKTYADASAGIPVADSGDGSITFTPTKEAAGQYIPSLVWAISADGTESWPLTVIFRVRNAPEVTSDVPTLQTLRGVDTVVRGSRLFSDVDVDTYQAESHDALTREIVSTPGRGTAWFDAAGDLHYRPLNLTEAYTDHVTVRAVDSFGYSSPEFTIPIVVEDVRPGCETGMTETDSNTPATVSLHCWLTGPEGWTQRPESGLEYAITASPSSGTLTGLDPISGRVTFAPEPGTEGPVTFTFQAAYNGEVRESRYTVVVHPAP